MGHRPKRGAAGPDIEIGDPFGQYEYQGGAAPGASESGDLQSREFGVPQADIPGGLNHLVNTEAHPVKPPKTPQQQPVINDHGVPPVDGTQYEFPAKADKQGHQPKPAPERRRQFDEAVPVRIEKDPDIRNPIWKLISEGPHTVTGPTAEPIRLADLPCQRGQHQLKQVLIGLDAEPHLERRAFGFLLRPPGRPMPSYMQGRRPRPRAAGRASRVSGRT